MGMWQDIKDALFYDEETPETVEEEPVHNVDVTDSNATWRPCNDKAIMWQLVYALNVVQNILTTFLVNVDWKTFRRGENVKGEEWYKFNVSPNIKQTSAEFFRTLASKLVNDGSALIIELANKELFIADSYNFKGGQEQFMKKNTFENVVVGPITLNRTFKENETALLIKTPNFDKVLACFQLMGADFSALKNLVQEGAEKALGMKLNLNLGAQAKNKYDEKYIQAMQRVYGPLMKARDAVFVTYKGENLTDLTEKQRGSEVQQVLEAVENNIKINDEILCNVGSAYGIPNKFMTGDFSADNDSVFAMAITMFAKPYIEMLSEKFTSFYLEKEDIINGSKIEGNLNSIKYVDKLSMATAIDKLIGSGAYSPNEVRETLDDDPFDGGDVRYITKNYAVLSEYTKGGNSNDEM